MGAELFRYDGKRVLVVGGATGMGAAAAQATAALGGEVVVLDVADVDYPVAQSIRVDLRDRESVDAAMRSVEGPLDAVFACAGVADGTPGIMLINFVAQRHLIEGLVDAGKLAANSGIVMISSVAGLMWQQQLPVVLDFLSQPDWDGMAKWVADHDGTETYAFSKMAINTYVAHEGFRLLQKLAEDVSEIGFVESSPKQDGRNMVMVLGPVRKKADVMAEQRAERLSRKQDADDLLEAGQSPTATESVQETAADTAEAQQ